MCMWMSEERKNIVVSHKKGWYAVGDIVTVQTNLKKTSSKTFPKNSSFKPKDGGNEMFSRSFPSYGSLYSEHKSMATQFII